MTPMCEAQVRQLSWPYVNKCREQAEYEIINSAVRNEIDARLLCGMHADLLMQSFPEVEVKQI